MALFLPVMAAVMLGTVDFGRFSKVSISVNNAAAVGALYASASVTASKDTQGIKAAALKELLAADGIDQQGINVTTSSPGTLDTAGYPMVTVTVTAVFKTLSNFPSSQVTIVRSSQMRILP